MSRLLERKGNDPSGQGPRVFYRIEERGRDVSLRHLATIKILESPIVVNTFLYLI